MNTKVLVSLLGKDPPLTQNEVRLSVTELQKIVDSSSMSPQNKALWREKIDEATAETIQTLLFKISNELKLTKSTISEVTEEDVISVWDDLF